MHILSKPVICKNTLKISEESQIMIAEGGRGRVCSIYSLRWTHGKECNDSKTWNWRQSHYKF